MAKRQVKFELTAVDRTKAAFSSVTKGLKGVGGVAKKATMGVAKVGLAATAAATAFAAIAKVNIDFMDKLGKTSSKLGITAEFLQNMRFAAEQTGVKVTALDMGLQRFIRRAAEAAQGTGEAKRAFEQLGIELKNDDGTLRDVRDVLFDVADGIQNTTSSAEQVRLAFKFFDSEGVSLVNTLKNGADGLRDFEQQAENLGIIISNQSIKKAEMFADRINVLKKQITAITSNITAAFIPILEEVGKQLTDIMAKAKGTEGGFESLGKTIAVNILEFIKQAMIGLLTFIDAVEQRIVDFANTKIGTKIFGDIGTEAQKAKAEFDEIKKRRDAIGETIIAGGDFFNDVFDTDKPIRGAENLQAEYERLTFLLEDLGNTILGTPPEESPFIKTLDKAIDSVKNFKIAIKEDDDDGDFVGGLTEKVSAFKDSLGVTQDNIDNAIINTMKNFEDRIIEGLRNGKLAFKDFADFVVEQLVRIAIQEAIVKPLTDKASGFFSNIFSRGDKTPSGEGGGYTGMGVRAGGIDGRGGFPAILHPNETVIDHTKGQGMGATVNFNISTVDAAGFDELLATRKNMIVSMVNQAYNSRGKMGIA